MKADSRAFDKGSNADEAYDELLRRLRSGTIGMSDRIVDTAIASELNMSRMPAREALLRLVNEGYLVGSTRGFRLPVLTREDVCEVFEIRKLLEPRAAARAAVERSEEHLRQMAIAVADQRASLDTGDVRAFISGTVRFREAWLDAVPNRRLVGEIQRFFDQVNAVRMVTLIRAETRLVSIRLAEQLLDAFERGDSLSVCEQMHEFISVAQRTYLATQDPPDDRVLSDS